MFVLIMIDDSQVEPLRCPLPSFPQWQEHLNRTRRDDRGDGSGWEPMGALLCLAGGKDNAYQGGNILAMIENRHPHHHHHVKPKNIFHVTLAEINGWGCLLMDFLLRGSPCGLISTCHLFRPGSHQSLPNWQVKISPPGDPLSRKSVDKHPHPLISAGVTSEILVGCHDDMFQNGR